MDWRYAVLLLIPLLVLAFFYKRRVAAPKVSEFPYVRRSAMFSPAEQAFLRLLDLAVGKDYRIFCKVRVADVLLVPQGGESSRWMRAYARIASRHFDYLLCYYSDLRPICAIELTDFGNTGDKGRNRHAFLNRACRVANLPLVTFEAQRSYSPAAIRQAVLELLGTNLPFAASNPFMPNADSLPESTEQANILADMAAERR